MANTILEQSYKEGNAVNDALKSSFSSGKTKDASNNFINILSNLTSQSKTSTTNQSKNTAASTMFKSSSSNVKNNQNNNTNLSSKNNVKSQQQDTSQVKNDSKKSNSTVSSKSSNNVDASKNSSDNTNSTNKVSDNENNVENTSENEDSKISQNTENEDNTTDTDLETATADTLTAVADSAVDEQTSALIASIDIQDDTTDLKTLDNQTSNNDDVIDLKAINTLKLSDADTKDAVETKTDDESAQSDEESDVVKIKVATETVDTDKTKDKSTKVQDKPQTEITKEMLNDLDAVVTGVGVSADDAGADSFSNGQDAVEQAVMLSIEGTSDTTDTQDFSKLLNVDMLNKLDSKSNIGSLNSVQTAKPVSNVDILNQISDKIAEMRNGTTDKIEIALKPANLGKVNVEISSAKGVLTATLIAENEQVKNTLDKNIDSLKNSLASQGVNLNSVNVKISDTEKSAMNNNFDFSKDQFMNDSQEHNKQERAQESHGSNKSEIGSLDESSKDEGDIVLTGTNTNEDSYYKGLVDYKI